MRQEGLSPGASEGAWLCDTLISDFWLQTWLTLLLLPPSAVLRSGSPKMQHCTCTLSLTQNSGHKWAAWAYKSEGEGKTPQSDTPLGTTLQDAVSKQSGATCCEKGRGSPTSLLSPEGPSQGAKTKQKKQCQCVSSKNTLTLAFLLFLNRNVAVKAHQHFFFNRHSMYYFHIWLKTRSEIIISGVYMMTSRCAKLSASVRKLP